MSREEKVNYNHEHDFKEWEEFHTINLAADKQDGGHLSLSSEAIPAYLKEYLAANQSLLAFLLDSRRVISRIRCGRKSGQHLSDADLTWGEHWLEVWLQDTQEAPKGQKAQQGADNIVRDVIVKHYCKFWVDAGTRLLDGESCL